MASDPKQPVSYSAVEVDGYAHLFYARKNGALAQLYQRGSNTTDDYHFRDIELNDVVLQGIEQGPLLTAVSWQALMTGWNYIRVYFLGEGRRLREICKDIPRGQEEKYCDWYEGAFSKQGPNRKGYSLAPESALTANVEKSTGLLKVYFTTKDSPYTFVAWTDPYTGRWEPARRIQDELR
ncbi:MAG: hypothetical protein M1828_006680 [Chrysothrix sp. TS-e1954]|nr:MAG: hypothetical protein M1828_006680 [Chrysothrix sp. TS-e1954]